MIREVTINKEAITRFAKEFASVSLESPGLDFFTYEWDEHQAIMLLLIFNAMNFCFWAEKDQPKWQIEVAGESLDGSYALLRTIEETAKQDPNFLQPAFLAKLKLTYLQKMLAGNVEIPMIEDRLNHLNNLGQVLTKRYQGDAFNLIVKSQGCAGRMLKRLTSEFECFQDDSVFKGKTIFFWKRAQLQVKMVSDYLHTQNKPRLRNMQILTAFADYKVPQILRHLGIIEYSAKLADMVDNYQLIEPGSDFENEIRIATIRAVQKLTLAVRSLGLEINASDIDSLLWKRAASNKDKMLPYHRTYTAAY